MAGLSRKIGIVAGSGSLPTELADACRNRGEAYLMLAFEGETPRETVASHPHFFSSLGAVGATLSALRAEGVTDLVLAGRIARPTLVSLRPDATALRWLARLGSAFFRGDDRLLRQVTLLLEEEGFRIIGAESVLVDALSPAGPIGKHLPRVKDREDMVKAFHLAKEIGRQDVGQAVIVRNGQVSGTEDAAGTDALIARCALLPGEGGVLVKASKPGQERRADLPAIGPRTVAGMKAGGFHGIGLEAGASLILRREETVAAADAAGLFLYGLNGVGQ